MSVYCLYWGFSFYAIENVLNLKFVIKMNVLISVDMMGMSYEEHGKQIDRSQLYLDLVWSNGPHAWRLSRACSIELDELNI